MPGIEGADYSTRWAGPCLGTGATISNFDHAGRLPLTVLLGTNSIRFPGLELGGDAEALKITNHVQVQEWVQAWVTKPYRKGWEPTWV